jgi:hypothetical protein
MPKGSLPQELSSFPSDSFLQKGQQSAHKTKIHPSQGGFGQWVRFGAPGRTRTCSLLIRSQTLCPLSYGRLMLDNSIAYYDVYGNLVMLFVEDMRP